VSQQPPSNDEQIIQSLSLVDQRVSGVVSAAGEDYEAICDLMDDLYEQGVNPASLSEIQDRTNALANTNQILVAAYESAVEAARVMRLHADQLADALERYKQAVLDLDPNLPETRAIYQRAWDEASITMYEAAYQTLPGEIYMSTGLTVSQAKILLDLITGDGGFIDESDPIWDDLAAWIERAESARDQAEDDYLSSQEDM
jgi:hypothetical protein